MEREPEEQVEKLQDRADRLEDQIDETRRDWERKKEDDTVPGAVGDVTEMDGDDAPETDYPTKT